MTTSEESVIRRLVDAFPELRAVLDQHFADNFGEMLPHLLMADIKRHVLAAYQASEDESLDRVKGILDQLEREFRTGDDAVRELIAVSFVELLPGTGESGSEIRDFLGPALAAEAERMA